MFATGAGLFFVGYFLFEVPSNLVLERIGGAPLDRAHHDQLGHPVGDGLVRGPASFYGLRFVLGITKTNLPGILFYLVCWFPTIYRARMMGLFTLGIPLSTVIGAPSFQASFSACRASWVCRAGSECACWKACRR